MLYGRLLLALLVGLMGGCAAGPSSGREIAPDGRVSPAPPTRAFAAVPPLHPSVDDYPDATLRLVGRSGQTVTVPSKVANTSSRRRHGLKEVPALPDGIGMLFVFPTDRRSGFWMKDTLVPLDIAFIDGDGWVKRILRMEPCRATPCPSYHPGITYRYALEVPAGWFEQVGVDTDWRLLLPEGFPVS